MRVLMLLIIGLFFQACQNAEDNTSDILTVEKYYAALNAQNVEAVPNLLSDSLSVGEGDYWSTYSKADYSNWLKWDAQFKPIYQILKINRNEQGVEVTVSKSCPRILFLNEAPVVSKEQFLLKNHKIYKLELIEYLEYDDNKWNANKEKIVQCIAEHQPALNGFIHDQTEQGALNYLSAIEFYQEKCAR